MSAPRRLLDDPATDAALRELLREAPVTRPLDPFVRRRLQSRISRLAALPGITAGWLFVKSAGATLGLMLGGGALVAATGVLEPSRPVPVQVASTAAATSGHQRMPAAAVPVVPAVVETVASAAAPASSESRAAGRSRATFSAPTPSATTLSAEALLLEQARREMRSAPAVALAIAGEHAQRFPRGQLVSERALIQIEALHRLGRDAEARTLAGALLSGAGAGLYAERVQRLLGENALR